ncbi:MAG: FG-GAP repeat domain-containing protein, partial [Rhodoferax sp.]
YPWKMALRDIDGDGAADLVVTDVGSTSGTADASVWLLRQNAGQRGRFLAPQRLIAASAYDAAIGDLNSDGAPDIVVAASLKPGRGATVLYQNPALRGVFFAPTLLALPGDATHVAIGDMNGDGRNDLVARLFMSTSNYVPSTSLGMAYQQPGGGFAQALTLSPQTGLNTALLAISDYNADGAADVVEFFTPSSSDYRAKVSTLLQSTPAGSFAVVDTSLSGVNCIDGGVVADLTGDGRPDFASVGFYPVGSPSTVSSSLNIFHQSGGGAFSLAATMAMPISSSRVAAGDINSDGLNDLVVLGHDNRVLVLHQSATAHGSFLAPYVLN